VTTEELKLLISGDSSSGQQAVQTLADAMSNSLVKALNNLNKESEDSKPKLGALQQLLEELTPSTKNAHAAFSDLQGTLKEMWEDPKAGIENLAKAMLSDLQPALGAIGIGAGVAVAALSAIGAIAFEVAEQVSEVGASIERGALASGIDAEQFSALKVAVESTGGSVDTLTNAAFMLERRLGDAGSTGQKTRDALEKLGISAEEFAQLPVDQQILKISEGFRGLDEGTNRATLAFDLFGRQGRTMLPELLQPMDELVQRAKDLGLTWSETDVKAAHDFEIQVNFLRMELGKLTTDVGKVLIPLFTEPLKFADKSLGWLLTESPIGQSLQQTKTIVDYFTFQPDANLPKVASPFTKDTTIKDQVDDLTYLGGAYNDTMVRNAESAKKFQDAVDKQKDSLLGDTDKIKAQVAALDSLTSRTDLSWATQQKMLEMIWKLEEAEIPLTERIYAWAEANDTGEEAAKKAQKELDETVKRMNEFEKEGVKAAESVGKGFKGQKDVLMGLSVAMGDTQLAAKPLTGSIGLMSDLSVQAAQHMYDLRDGVNSWGLTMRNVLGDVPRLLEQAFTTGGSLTSGLKGIETSLGSQLFGEGGPLGFGAGGLMNSIGNKLTSVFGTSFGLALPGIGGAIGSMIGPLLGKLLSIGGPSQEELQGRQVEGQFEQQFGSFDAMMKAVGDAYAATGRSAQQAQADVAALMRAEKQGGDAAKAAVDQINQAFTDQKQDAADLDAAIKKYNFSIQELGPAMQKQQLDQQAQTLLNDWRLLVGSGIDVATVNAHMASSINDYLKLARQTGQEVPAAMEPILLKMIDQGQLVDDNGKKITDMKDVGVSFSETMTQGFQKVVDKLDQLLQKIGMVPAALNAIPTNTDININARVSQVDDGGSDLPKAAKGIYATGSRGVATWFGESGEAELGGPVGFMSDVLQRASVGTAGVGGGITINVAGSVWAARDLAMEMHDQLSTLLRDRYPQRPS